MTLIQAETIVKRLLTSATIQKTQKAYRYVVLLPQVPVCTAENNELLRFVESGELPTYSKEIPLEDAIEGTAKLALEFEHTFAEHSTRFNDVHAPKTFSSVIEPLCKDHARLIYAFCTLRHLFEVTNFKSSDDSVNAKIRLDGIQKVVSRCIASQYTNAAFYRAVKEVSADQQFLNFWQLRLCERYMRESRMNGAELGLEKRRALSQTRFKLDHDLRKFQLHVAQTVVEKCNQVKDPTFLVDTPQYALYEWSLDPKNYLKGPYLVTLSHSGYNTFMTYCRERLLRFKHFIYWNSRASFQEPNPHFNNSIVVDDIRLGRSDEAKCLGFKSYAEMSLMNKMAYSLDEVEEFLTQLCGKSRSKFQTRLKDMQLYAKRHEMVGDPLKPWDYNYYARKLIETATEFNPAEFSSCFPYFRTWRNLLNLTQKMFNITYVDVSKNVQRWHESVKVLSVRDASTGEEKGLIYVDAHIRPGKMKSNWISHGRDACQFNGYKPIVYLNFNIMAGEKFEAIPVSLNLLLCLAKSLGDALGSILTNSPYSSMSGIQTLETDGSKIYSELMKWLVLEPSVLSRLSSDRLSVQDADIAREVYIESTLPILLRECFLSEFDMALNTAGNIHWRDIYKEIHRSYYDTPLDKADNYPCSFLEIMTAQGAASYYGNLWSEMVACDTLAAFKEAGSFDNDKALAEMGKKYRETFFSMGGGLNTRKIFQNFRGRDLKYNHLFEFYKF